MGVGFVQKSPQLFADGASSISPSLTGCTAGNFVDLVVASSDPGVAGGSLAPPAGWTTAQAPTAPDVIAYDPVCAIFYKEDISSGTQSGTVNLLSGASYAQATIAEFSGVATASALDVSTSSTGSSSTSAGTGSVSNTVADAVAIVICHPEDASGGMSSLSSPAATGYTVIDTNPDNVLHAAADFSYKILSATGSQSGSWTWTGSCAYANSIAVFRGAGEVVGFVNSSAHPGRGPEMARFAFQPQPLAELPAPTDVTDALTGVAATAAAGTVAPATALALTGVEATAAVGTVLATRTVSITGVAATGAVGTLLPATAPPLTGTPGSGAAGTVVPAAVVPLTGVSATGATGTVTPDQSVIVALTGVSATGAVGTVSPATVAALSGIAATAVAGEFLEVNNPALTGVQAAGSTGGVLAATSKALTGVSATGSAGTVSASSTVALTGTGATGAAGNVSASLAVGITGNSATSATGTVTPVVDSPDVTVALTGVSATGEVGSVSAETEETTVVESGGGGGGIDPLPSKAWRYTPPQRRVGALERPVGAAEAQEEAAEAAIFEAAELEKLAEQIKAKKPPAERAEATSRYIEAFLAQLRASKTRQLLAEQERQERIAEQAAQALALDEAMQEQQQMALLNDDDLVAISVAMLVFNRRR